MPVTPRRKLAMLGIVGIRSRHIGLRVSRRDIAVRIRIRQLQLKLFSLCKLQPHISAAVFLIQRHGQSHLRAASADADGTDLLSVHIRHFHSQIIHCSAEGFRERSGEETCRGSPPDSPINT